MSQAMTDGEFANAVTIQMGSTVLQPYIGQQITWTASSAPGTTLVSLNRTEGAHQVFILAVSSNAGEITGINLA